LFITTCIEKHCTGSLKLSVGEYNESFGFIYVISRSAKFSANEGKGRCRAP